MNLQRLKYESLSFADQLLETSKTVKGEKDLLLKMQLVWSGSAITSLYVDAENKVDFNDKLDTLRKAIKEALYWLQMLFAARCISLFAFKSLENSATHLLGLLKV